MVLLSHFRKKKDFWRLEAVNCIESSLASTILPPLNSSVSCSQSMNEFVEGSTFIDWCSVLALFVTCVKLRLFPFQGRRNVWKRGLHHILADYLKFNPTCNLVLIFSQNSSSNGPYVVLNFCKLFGIIVLIFAKSSYTSGFLIFWKVSISTSSLLGHFFHKKLGGP